MTAVSKNVTFATSSAPSTSPAILPHTSVKSSPTKPQNNGHYLSVDGQTFLNSTNFKYLKHVLLKFMTSTEDEVGLKIKITHIAFLLFKGYSSYSCRIYITQFFNGRRTTPS